MRSINTIIVHCSATKPSMDIGVEKIRQWHKAKGWSDIGYHRVIRRDGTIEIGRPIQKVGAHAKGFNKNSVGVCLIGGIDDKGKPENNFTEKQFDALYGVVNNYRQDYDVETILGHTDLPHVAKACPCFDVESWLKNADAAEKEMPVCA